jgi:hypothetical protein
MALAAIVVAAAALRFATLDLQSFGQDELVTDWLVRMPLHSMLDTLPRTEATPPLYYLVAWFWTRLFGFGEVGIRSLSALLGTLTVLVVGQMRMPRLSPRVPLAAAALVAFSPLLVWYSQEARAYALFGLLAAASFVLTLRAMSGDGDRRAYVAWGVVAILMAATHYFSIFLLVPEVVWMAQAGRRQALAAGGVALAAWIALLPLELAQRNRQFGDYGPGSIENVLRLPKQLLTGLDSPGEYLTAPAAALFAILLLWLAFHGPRPGRRLATIAAATGAAATIAGIAVALVGVGFLSPRYFVGALIPSLVALAPGVGMSRLGAAACALLCSLGLGISVAVWSDPTYQRVDYRAAAKAIGPPVTERAIVLTPGSAFQIYVPDARNFPGRSLVREIVVIGLAYEDAGEHRPPRTSAVAAPAGFRLVQRRFGDRYTLLRFRASRPRDVSSSTLGRLHLAGGQNETILIQRTS